MTAYLVNIFINIINSAGYAGVSFLMIMESMILPVPSEAVMPFAGFLWFLGKMSFCPIVIFSTMGSIIGSLLSYGLGFYGGRPLIEAYGKYFLLRKKDLATAEKFFSKFGDWAVFISRFIPVIRHISSVPAGIAKMNLFKFIIYTVAGASLWNAFLAYLGYVLGSNWLILTKYGEIVDIILVVLFAGVVGFFFYKRRG